MANYPLYNQLVNSWDLREDKTIDIRKVCNTINDIGRLPAHEAKGHFQEIGAIIVHYGVLHGANTNTMPYHGKTMIGGKGILFTISSLPKPLQQLLAQYVEWACQQS